MTQGTHYDILEMQNMHNMHQGRSQDFKLGGPRGSRPGGPRASEPRSGERAVANTGGRRFGRRDARRRRKICKRRLINPIPNILVQKSLKSI